MRVLVVDPVKGDRDLVVRHVGGIGRTIVTAGDLRSAQASVDETLPDLVILDPSIGVAAAMTIVKHLRRDAAVHPHILICTAKISSSDLTSLLNAGADDFMKKPLDRDELVLRAGARDRLAKWAPKVFGVTHEVDDGAGAITGLKAWQSIDEAAAKDIGQLLGCAMVKGSGSGANAPTCDYVSALALTQTERKIDVRFTIGVQRDCIHEIARHVFGTDQSSEDELLDVTREFANLIAGRFKGSAAGEALALTMGLPSSDDSSRTRRATLASRSFELSDPQGTIRVNVVAEVLSSPLRAVRASDLREGMILAHPVLNANGGMLVPAGRLTQLRIARVVRALPAATEVEVAHAEELSAEAS
jgi:CheY-like chemotaxis protein